MSELQSLIKDCEKYIDIRGIDETIINAYLDTCQLAKMMVISLQCLNARQDQSQS